MLWHIWHGISNSIGSSLLYCNPETLYDEYSTAVLAWGLLCSDGFAHGKTYPRKGSLWTPGQLVDYVRRANKARIEAQNKAEKESK